MTLYNRRIGCASFPWKPRSANPFDRVSFNLVLIFKSNYVDWITDIRSQTGHVNNVTYVRYAESARVNWTRNIGIHIDQTNKKKWLDLLSSKGIGLILRSIKVDYKFVSLWSDSAGDTYQYRHIEVNKHAAVANEIPGQDLCIPQTCTESIFILILAVGFSPAGDDHVRKPATSCCSLPRGHCHL